MNYSVNKKMKDFKKIQLDEVLLVIGIICLFISMIFKYYGASYILPSEGSRLWEQLGSSTLKDTLIKYVGFVSLICCSLLQIKKYKNLNTIQVLSIFAIFFISLISICHFILLVMDDGLVSTLYYSTSPIVYVLILTIFIGANDRLYCIFIRINKYITIIALLIAFAMFIDFKSIHPDGIIGNSGFLNFYILGFFSALITCYNLKSKLISYLIIFLCLILAFCATSRSFIIQSLIFLFFYIILKAKKKVIATIFFVICGIIFFMGALTILKKYFVSSYEYFMYKMFVDTRTSQYEQLFVQIKWFEIIVGGGYNFQYVYNGVLYSYFDNSFVFLMMRYGLIFVFPLVWIFLAAIFISFKNKNYEYFCSVIQWVAALAGLSIYFVIGLDLKFLIFYIILGKIIFSLSGEKNVK